MCKLGRKPNLQRYTNTCAKIVTRVGLITASCIEKTLPSPGELKINRQKKAAYKGGSLTYTGLTSAACATLKTNQAGQQQQQR
jgi:hypothetical protein